MAESPYYPEPYDRTLWKNIHGDKPANDYMVAVDPTTGKALAVWEGTTTRQGAFPEGVVQMHVRQPTRESARQWGEAQLRFQRQRTI